MATDVLTMSSKGQVVIPSDIRRELQLDSGDRFAVYAHDGMIILTKIDVPSREELSRALDEAQEWARGNGLGEGSVDDAVAAVRARRGGRK